MNSFRDNHIPTELLPHDNSKRRVRVELYIPILVSLKERDKKVLAQLFEREDSEEIIENINSKLSMMMPEPCWEDNPFNFLSEYL